MKKLVVVAFLAVALAACGAKSSGSTTPASDPGQPAGGTGGNTYGAPAGLGDGAPGAPGADDPSAASEFVDPCAPGE